MYITQFVDRKLGNGDKESPPLNYEDYVFGNESVQRTENLSESHLTIVCQSIPS